MQKTNPKRIIALSRRLSNMYHHDPFALAEDCKITISYARLPNQTATIFQHPQYTPVMLIDQKHKYNSNAKNLLCAHEIGHYCMHPSSYNTFGVTPQNTTQKEYEANLFAVAFLCSDDEFCMPLEKMSNSMLTDIINKNL